MKRLCFLAVAAAVIALSEAADCPILGDGETKYLPHETDCHKYYECTKAGGKKLQDCSGTGKGKWCFDNTIEACVLPTEDCCKNTHPPEEGGDGTCTNDSKCKMRYSDDIVEVCVKKTSTGTFSKVY